MRKPYQFPGRIKKNSPYYIALVSQTVCISVSLCNTHIDRSYHGLYMCAPAGCVSDQLVGAWPSVEVT